MMRPPVERPPGVRRGTAGDAARVLAVGAVVVGGVAVALMAPFLLRSVGAAADHDPVASLAAFAPLAGVMSWILSIAAVLTAAAALRSDGGDRRARGALILAAPGAVLGTVAVVLVVVWIASWDPIA